MLMMVIVMAVMMMIIISMSEGVARQGPVWVTTYNDNDRVSDGDDGGCDADGDDDDGGGDGDDEEWGWKITYQSDISLPSFTNMVIIINRPCMVL